eukprot:TRINITY_DN2190_c1_g2_i1.p1 TRINITY_DN2190_c1_g2~~TRINITY_DN2190_c1_g2_i1.p1  ORF type:complete len:680 (+),score=146.38 TRINITY_DN2190_c1_g2_i1:1964-4003(+)
MLSVSFSVDIDSYSVILIRLTDESTLTNPTNPEPKSFFTDTTTSAITESQATLLQKGNPTADKKQPIDATSKVKTTPAPMRKFIFSSDPSLSYQEPFTFHLSGEVEETDNTSRTSSLEGSTSHEDQEKGDSNEIEDLGKISYQSSTLLMNIVPSPVKESPQSSVIAQKQGLLIASGKSSIPQSSSTAKIDPSKSKHTPTKHSTSRKTKESVVASGIAKFAEVPANSQQLEHAEPMNVSVNAINKEIKPNQEPFQQNDTFIQDTCANVTDAEKSGINQMETSQKKSTPALHDAINLVPSAPITLPETESLPKATSANTDSAIQSSLNTPVQEAPKSMIVAQNIHDIDTHGKQQPKPKAKPEQKRDVSKDSIPTAKSFVRQNQDPSDNMDEKDGLKKPIHNRPTPKKHSSPSLTSKPNPKSTPKAHSNPDSGSLPTSSKAKPKAQPTGPNSKDLSKTLSLTEDEQSTKRKTKEIDHSTSPKPSMTERAITKSSPPKKRPRSIFLQSEGNLTHQRSREWHPVLASLDSSSYEQLVSAQHQGEVELARLKQDLLEADLFLEYFRDSAKSLQSHLDSVLEQKASEERKHVQIDAALKNLTPRIEIAKQNTLLIRTRMAQRRLFQTLALRPMSALQILRRFSSGEGQSKVKTESQSRTHSPDPQQPHNAEKKAMAKTTESSSSVA